MKIKNEYNLEQGFFILSTILICTIPLGYFFSSLFFGLWFAYCIYWVFKTNRVRLNKKILPFLFFSGYILLSFIWTQNSEPSFGKCLRQIPLFLISLAGLFLPKISKKTFDTYFGYFIYYLTFLAIVLFTIALFRYNKYQFQGFLFYHDLVSPLDLNAIYMAYMVSVSLIYKVENWSNKILNYSVLLVLGIFLLLLSSKNVLFATIIVLSGVLFFKLKKPLTKAIVLSSVVFLTVISLIFFKPLKQRFEAELNTSYNEIFITDNFKKGRVYTGTEVRLLQVRAYFEVVNDPFEYLFGLGLSGSEDKLKEFHKKLNTPSVFQTYNFHNQYLQVLAELGIVGLIFFIISLWSVVLQSFNKKILLPFIIISMVLFFSESIIWRQRGILFFGILYLIIFTIKDTNEGKK